MGCTTSTANVDDDTNTKLSSADIITYDTRSRVDFTRLLKLPEVNLESFPSITEHEEKKLIAKISEEYLKILNESLDQFKNLNEDQVKNMRVSDQVHWAGSFTARAKTTLGPDLLILQAAVRKRRIHTTFVLIREKVLELGYYPKHEEALKLGLLEEVEINNLRVAFITKKGGKAFHIWFISHKWIGNNPDDEANKCFLESCVENSTPRYIWFDYSCVPQDDQDAKMKHLLSIPYICDELTVVPFHVNEELKLAYGRSVWCQLEAALLQWEAPNFDENQSWTIFNWNDVYQVLPGFLELFVFSAKNWRFYEGAENNGLTRTKMLASMLREFLKFHHSNFR